MIMIDGKNFFDQPVKMVLEQINTFERLPLVKEMITPLFFC